MRGLRFIGLLWLLLLPLACERQPATFYVLETNDLHGELGNEMAGIAGYIRRASQQYGDSLIVLDCGDLLQGTPEIFFSNYVDTTNVHVYADVINWLKYDAIAVGNHDFESGRNIYTRLYSNIKAPILCANIVRSANGKPYFSPYTILRRNGYKIAILGMVTTSALSWFPEDLREGLDFLTIEESTAYWVPKILKKEKPDVLIGLFHTGDNEVDPDSAKWMAQKFDGIDLICCGHIHKANVSQEIAPNGDTVSIMQAGAYASHIGEAKITVTPQPKGKPTVQVSARVIPTDSLMPDPDYISLLEPFHKRASIYNDVPISTIDTTIYSSDALYGPSAWVDLLHESYRKITESMGYVGPSEVEVTIVSPSLRDAVLYAGPLTVRDFTLLYPHENTLSVVEMTGVEIKEYLEYVHSLPLENPDNPIYDFDSASGIVYYVYKDKPYGSRVKILRMANGNTFYEAKRYRVAMNSFRAMGGGGHLGKGLHWSSERMRKRTLAVSEKSIRAMFLEIYAEEPIHLLTMNSWSYQ